MTGETSSQGTKALREKVRRVHHLLVDLKAPLYYLRHYPTLSEKVERLLEETGAKGLGKE